MDVNWDSPGPLPSWPDTRQLRSWSHILPTDCGSVWVHCVLTSKTLSLFFTKLYCWNCRVLTATGGGGVNTFLTGFKLFIWPQNKQIKLFLTFLRVPFLQDSIQKQKNLQACLAWNQKALACREGGGKTTPVLSLPCPTWSILSFNSEVLPGWLQFLWTGDHA